MMGLEGLSLFVQIVAWNPSEKLEGEIKEKPRAAYFCGTSAATAPSDPYTSTARRRACRMLTSVARRPLRYVYGSPHPPLPSRWTWCAPETGRSSGRPAAAAGCAKVRGAVASESRASDGLPMLHW